MSLPDGAARVPSTNWLPGDLSLRPLTQRDAHDIAEWRYDGPWSVYDDGELLRERDAYLAVVDPLGALVGFACMGTQARVPGISADPGVLDLGLGMRPDLVGRGRGRIVAEAVLAHCAQASSAQTARACIQPWNVRSRRLASSVGFSEVGEHTCLQDGRQVAYIVLVAPLHRLD